jgi:cellulose synthase/poly-beta-1,6-N-acetylglucosamine synthase-like glycosyltransferase
MSFLLALFAYATAAVLLAFSLRRAVFLITACLPQSPNHPITQALNVLILIPCRNEAQSLPGLFDALDRLDYPREQMRVVIVDDGSTDDTTAAARALTASRPWAQLISLSKNVGKAQALNEALDSPSPGWERGPGGEGEILVVFDADHHPAPSSLRALVAPLVDARVAAVSGQMRVANGNASPAAFYAMVESHVHQLVTMRAKDRLDLAPAILGSNCAYRLSALRAVGGFRRGALLEDSDLTLAFALAGWRTRFASDSISEHHAPTTVRGYIQQHLRWNRGFHQVAGGRLASLWTNPKVKLKLKLELTFFALGYADRLALITGALITLVDLLRPGAFHFPLVVWPIFFGLPALEMPAALAIAREPPRTFLQLVCVPFFFALDIAIALWSNVETLARRPFAWSTTDRFSTTKDTKSAEKAS